MSDLTSQLIVADVLQKTSVSGPSGSSSLPATTLEERMPSLSCGMRTRSSRTRWLRNARPAGTTWDTGRQPRLLAGVEYRRRRACSPGEDLDDDNGNGMVVWICSTACTCTAVNRHIRLHNYPCSSLTLLASMHTRPLLYDDEKAFVASRHCTDDEISCVSKLQSQSKQHLAFETLIEAKVSVYHWQLHILL